jgi:hypothetical protein
MLALRACAAAAGGDEGHMRCAVRRRAWVGEGTARCGSSTFADAYSETHKAHQQPERERKVGERTGAGPHLSALAPEPTRALLLPLLSHPEQRIGLSAKTRVRLWRRQTHLSLVKREIGVRVEMGKLGLRGFTYSSSQYSHEYTEIDAREPTYCRPMTPLSELHDGPPQAQDRSCDSTL